MKRRKFNVILIFFAMILLISNNVRGEHHRTCGNYNPYFECKGENCGKVIGWLLDPKTMIPIENEKFDVLFLDCRESVQLETQGARYKKFKIAKVDKRGHFSMKIEEGEYCITVMPMDYSGYDLANTRYATEPYPGCNNNKFRIRIKRGMITVVKKNLTYGGSIGLKFIDEESHKINLVKKYSFKIKDKEYAGIVLFDSVYNCVHEVMNVYEKSDGNYIKKIAKNIYPGKYKAIINLFISNCMEKEDVEYAPIAIKEIVVESGKERVVPVILDEKTGLIIKVVDEQNNPIRYADVNVKDKKGKLGKSINVDYKVSSVKCRTNNNGECKILNLKNWIDYEINVSYDERDKRYKSRVIKGVRVKKGHIKTLKIQLEVTEEEGDE
jgi:hypothetical protein